MKKKYYRNNVLCVINILSKIFSNFFSFSVIKQVDKKDENEGTIQIGFLKLKERGARQILWMQLSTSNKSDNLFFHLKELKERSS